MYSVHSQTLSPARLARSQRLMLGAGGLVLLALFITVRILQPSSSGLGTHQQLGLPPCTVVQLFGLRCPSCGMTTSWAHLVRGDLSAACAANVGGALLGVLAMIACPWALASAITGRYLGASPTTRGTVLVLCVLVAITLVDWVRRLCQG